jgi:hypothetical protein
MSNQRASSSEIALRMGRFRLDIVEAVFDGYTTGDTWNGWATPVFAEAEAKKIVDALSSSEEPLAFDSDNNAVIWYSRDWGEVRYDATLIGFDNSTVRAYPVGTREWTWVEV